MKVTPIFRWYDLWIGVFVDTKKRTVYVFPMPCFGVKIAFRMPEIELPPTPTWEEIQAIHEREHRARMYEI